MDKKTTNLYPSPSSPQISLNTNIITNNIFGCFGIGISRAALTHASTQRSTSRYLHQPHPLYRRPIPLSPCSTRSTRSVTTTTQLSEGCLTNPQPGPRTGTDLDRANPPTRSSVTTGTRSKILCTQSTRVLVQISNLITTEILRRRQG